LTPYDRVRIAFAIEIGVTSERIRSKIIMTHINLQRENANGFTLVELMIVVAIIAILATIAMPNLIAFRNKSRVATAVSSIESIRSALAGYITDSRGNSYPTTINNYAELASLVNAHGATLKPTEEEQGFELLDYTSVDANGDEIRETYSMSFLVRTVPETLKGRLIRVSPSSIDLE
jgi:prepilin-type N-terminal cleavage/methylation domain-containing protein